MLETGERKKGIGEIGWGEKEVEGRRRLCVKKHIKEQGLNFSSL